MTDEQERPKAGMEDEDKLADVVERRGTGVDDGNNKEGSANGSNDGPVALLAPPPPL